MSIIRVVLDVLLSHSERAAGLLVRHGDVAAKCGSHAGLQHKGAKGAKATAEDTERGCLLWQRGSIITYGELRIRAQPRRALLL